METPQAFAIGYLSGALAINFLIQVGIGWGIRKLFKKRATFLVALWTIAIPMVFLVLAGLASIGGAIESGEASNTANNPILVLIAFPFAVLVSVLFRRR